MQSGRDGGDPEGRNAIRFARQRSHRDPEQSARQRDQQAVGKKLPRQSPARCAERQPCANLTIASRSTRQEQTGDIQASQTQQAPRLPRIAPTTVPTAAALAGMTLWRGSEHQRGIEEFLPAFRRDYGKSWAAHILLQHGLEPRLQPCLQLLATSRLDSSGPAPASSACGDRRRSLKPGMTSVDIDAGIQSDGTWPTSMPWNVEAATPMMVNGCRFTSTFRPTTSGAPPSCVFQKS